jgi:hypothetical protein
MSYCGCSVFSTQPTPTPPGRVWVCLHLQCMLVTFGFGATQFDFVEVHNRSDRDMQMVLSKIPSQTTSSGLQALGFQSANKRQLASSFLAISAPAIQDGAHRLLLDKAVPHQSVFDLAMGNSTTQANIKIAPKITEFFIPETPVSRLLPRAEDGSLEDEQPVPLGKPTTVHLERYREVSLPLPHLPFTDVCSCELHKKQKRS